MHGYGIYTWRAGDLYYGRWKQGNRDGKGHYRWADGREYYGEFKDNMKWGQGTFLENGKIFRDTYHKNVRTSRSELEKVDSKE